MKRKSKPEKIGAVLERFFKKAGLEKGIRQNQAIMIWEEIVGEKIAAKAIPDRIEHGRLYVKVENSVWKQELHFLKKDIIKKLNAAEEYAGMGCTSRTNHRAC